MLMQLLCRAAVEQQTVLERKLPTTEKSRTHLLLYVKRQPTNSADDDSIERRFDLIQSTHIV